MLSRLVEDIVCVSKKEIAQAMAYFQKYEGKLVEGAGAAAFAGLLKSGPAWDLGEVCCVVVSGGNIDFQDFSRITGKYADPA